MLNVQKFFAPLAAFASFLGLLGLVVSGAISLVLFIDSLASSVILQAVGVFLGLSIPNVPSFVLFLVCVSSFGLLYVFIGIFLKVHTWRLDNVER
jgi:hypothetical protein